MDIECLIISSQLFSLHMNLEILSNIFLSLIKQCLMTSANPDFNSFSDNVFKKFVSIITQLGSLKIPIRFFKLLKSTPNFPPTLAST